MHIIEFLLLGIALAADCFSVSLACGIVQKRMGHQVLWMTLSFAFFQMLMPFISWFFGSLFMAYLEDIDHWIAFLLLLFLGGKMIRDGIWGEEKSCAFNPSRPATLLTLSLATSIDALAVGLSFVGMGIRTLADVVPPLACIGVTTFLFTLIGKYFGIYIGNRRHFSAEVIGGIILIFIGIRVLVTHLLDHGHLSF